MSSTLAQDWPVYVLLAVVFIFFVFVVISGRIQDKKEKSNSGREKNKNI